MPTFQYLVLNMDDIEINNHVLVEDLYDGATWIHGSSKSNIYITVFLITICSDQLQHSLRAINELDLTRNICVNVIMNVSPTNKAYNEMRLRCTTKYFVQNDEDMELYPNSLKTMYRYINNPNTDTVFLHTFKLIDTCLGTGTPPLIDCLKLYTNELMRQYPTYTSGEEAVSSVDNLWHAPLVDAGYTCVDTKRIIGFHGKHRTHFDLMLRHCKGLSSILDPRIKTNSGHLCKILRSLCKTPVNVVPYFRSILQHFMTFGEIDITALNNAINSVNGYIAKSGLDAYNIHDRQKIPSIKGPLVINSDEFSSMYDWTDIDSEQFFCIVGIMCVATNNYAYSKDKYPWDIYKYFDDILKRNSIPTGNMIQTP
jgi:hypothetical protein